MARPAPDDPPPSPSRLFWICALVLVMVVAYVLASLATGDETVRVLVAAVVGIAVFVPLRERIWGGDLATARARSRDPRADADRRRR